MTDGPRRDTTTYAYLRISQDRGGTFVSVANQRADLRALGARLGLVVNAEFVDNDTSAFSGRERPGYRALVDAVQEGGPCTILVWHVDRLYRRPKELEALLDLVERHPVRIETVRGGGLDLNGHEGQLQARMLVSMASYESGHKADRIRLAARRAAARGEWHGPRRFGYQLATGHAATIDPAEGPVAREVFDRFLAGESIHSITRWLNDGTVRPLRAQVWNTTTVRQMLAAPRMAGLRAYQPRSAGDPAETPFRDVAGPGLWPGIITVEEHELVVATLRQPGRRTAGRGENLLSGIAECGICGTRLVIASNAVGNNGQPRKRYVCKKIPGRPERGGLSIERDPLDRAVTEAILRRLSATPAPPRAGSDPAPRWEAVVVARRRMESLAAEYGAGELDREEYRAARGGAMARLEAAERDLATSTRSAALKTVPLGDRPSLEGRWAAMSVGQRRAVVEALVEALVINPAVGPSRSLDLGRIDLRWRA